MKQAIYLFSILIFFIRCENKVAGEHLNTGTKNASGSIPNSSCPLFTNDADGNIVLSYVKEINDTVAYFCYVISKDNGATFSNPIEINETHNVHPHGENLPKIIFKPGGEVIAMWGASNPNPNSKYSGIVYYTQSFDNGKTWTAATTLVKDTSAYDQRYFDMALLPGGEVMAIWLDNRGKKEKEGSTLFCAVTNGKKGFSAEKPIAETCCQCCRTDLFVDSKGNIHASFRDIINDSIRDMVHLISTDAGRNFSKPMRISEDNWVVSGCPHTGPTVAESDNKLHFAWYTMGGGKGVFYCQSANGGATYSTRDTVSSRPSAKHPQIIGLPSDNLVIAWDENIKRDEKTDSHIGIQLRSSDGKIIATRYLSPAGAVCEFPTVYPLNENAVLVGFTQQEEGMKKIAWKRLNIGMK